MTINGSICLFVDIDECTRRTHNCHPSLGRCVNTVGSFSCYCINQFTGDGRICSRLVDGKYTGKHLKDRSFFGALLQSATYPQYDQLALLHVTNTNSSSVLPITCDQAFF